MTTYAIGDIHGCFGTLTRLLQRIDFDQQRDKLWLVGDLVNRGPRSLDVLRWARGLGSSLTMVLGNHDLHLLAYAEGLRVKKPRDTLDEILDAPDRDELLDWLARRPLLVREGRFALVHAGLLPAWSVERADSLAREVEVALRSPSRRAILGEHSREQGGQPEGRTSNIKTLRRNLSVLTRLRICDANGQPHMPFGDSPDNAPAGCTPWFDARPESDLETTFVFGHWARLGLHLRTNLIGLDTGCVWGGALSAVCLESGEVFQERYVG